MTPVIARQYEAVEQVQRDLSQSLRAIRLMANPDVWEMVQTTVEAAVVGGYAMGHRDCLSDWGRAIELGTAAEP